MGGPGSWAHSSWGPKNKLALWLWQKQEAGCEVSWVILGIWTPVQLFWDSVVGVREQREGEVIIAKTISWELDFRKCRSIKNIHCVGVVVGPWLTFNNCVHRSQRIWGTQEIFIQGCVCGWFIIKCSVGWGSCYHFKSDIYKSSWKLWGQTSPFTHWFTISCPPTKDKGLHWFP